MESFESWKKEVEGKFDKFLSHSKAQADAMEELRSMFKTTVGKEKLLDKDSPSVTESALENQQQGASKPRKGAGKEKQQVVITTGRKEGSEVDVGDPTLEVPKTQHPLQPPPTSTSEVDILFSSTGVQDLPPSQTEEHVEVTVAGFVNTPSAPDNSGPSGDSNSEDDGFAAMNSEVSAGKELFSHDSPPTAQERSGEGAPAAASLSQRKCKRLPKSLQKVLFPPDVGLDSAPSPSRTYSS